MKLYIKMYKYIYTNIQHRSAAVHELISNVYCSLIRLIVVVLALRHLLSWLIFLPPAADSLTTSWPSVDSTSL